MPKKSEPPICCVSGWKTDHERQSYQKSFHFDSAMPMTDFCLSIMTSYHDQSTRLSVIECHDTNDIKVEVLSKPSHQKKVYDIIKVIEACYEQFITKNSNENGNSIWSKWLQGFGK